MFIETCLLKSALGFIRLEIRPDVQRELKICHQLKYYLYLISCGTLTINYTA